MRPWTRWDSIGTSRSGSRYRGKRAGGQMIHQLDAADLDDAVTVGGIEARRFGIEHDFTHHFAPAQRRFNSATMFLTCSKA